MNQMNRENLIYNYCLAIEWLTLFTYIMASAKKDAQASSTERKDNSVSCYRSNASPKYFAKLGLRCESTTWATMLSTFLSHREACYYIYNKWPKQITVTGKDRECKNNAEQLGEGGFLYAWLQSKGTCVRSKSLSDPMEIKVEYLT